MKETKSIVAPRFLSSLYAIAIATDMAEVKRRGKYKFPIYLSKSLMEADLDLLELSVRSGNCLRRAGFRTVGDLVTAIDSDEDLKRIRNCGKTSTNEIMNALLCFQYELLSTERRKRYIERIKELNQAMNI